MAEYQFERDSRTPYSESYVITSGGDDVGRVDIHFTSSLAYATLCVPEAFSEDEIQELISEIDERLVLTTDPYREDFVVTVWAGRQVGIYSEEEVGEEELEEEEEVEEGNGHHE
jgi:hypothetical protein